MGSEVRTTAKELWISTSCTDSSTCRSWLSTKHIERDAAAERLSTLIPPWTGEGDVSTKELMASMSLTMPMKPLT